MTDDLVKSAVQAHLAGNLPGAETLYGQVLAADPENVVAMTNLGTVYLQTGRMEDGVRQLQAALDLAPVQPDAQNNLAKGLQALERFDEALDAFGKVLRLSPNHADGLNGRALLLDRMGRLEDAQQAWDQAAKGQPDAPEPYHAQAMVLRRLGKSAAALAALRKAAARGYDAPDLHNDMGVVLDELDRPEEALTPFARALELQPGMTNALNNRGLALHKLRRFTDALADFDAALAIDPVHRSAWYNRAETLVCLGEFEDALASVDQALALDPAYVDAWIRKADILGFMRRIDDADDAYAQALELDPGNTSAPLNLSIPLLRAGQFEDGLPLYEWRWKGPLKDSVVTLPRPVWTGEESLAGKTLLMHAEQGLGDTLMMLRYAPVLSRAGARVIVTVQAPLEILAAEVEGIEAVIPHGVPLPPYDTHIPMMSLPLATKTRSDTIPGEPYLKAPPARREAWKARLGAHKRPRIGLVWSGNAGQADDYRRSMTLKALEPLFGLDADLYSLQIEYRPVDRELFAASPIKDISPDMNGFGDTAAAMEEMDLVITVCTASANLAGGLGKPAFVMINALADWRWGLDAPTTPWYPSARLFRQAKIGAWKPVVAEVKAEAQAFLKTL